jgi:pimeloyl-ACP methyl ester carboxylesterase
LRAEAMFAHFHSVMARIDIAYTLDIVDKVRKIVVPTLIVHGKHCSVYNSFSTLRYMNFSIIFSGTDDHFTKKDSFRLNELIANSELQSLPGGHLPHVTSPKAFAHMITDFIQRKLQ